MSGSASSRWAGRIDIEQPMDADLPFEEVRDGMVVELAATAFHTEDREFRELVDELSCSEDAEGFDITLDDLYDWADGARIILKIKLY